MTRRDSEFEVLRKAWNELQAPSVHREIAEEDAGTRRAVQWIREAYLASEPPAVPLPQAGSRPSKVATAIALAVAASIFALTAALLWQLPQRSADVAPVELAKHPTPKTLPQQTPQFDRATGQVELRSGPVRLIMLSERKSSRKESHGTPETPDSRGGAGTAPDSERGAASERSGR